MANGWSDVHPHSSTGGMKATPPTHWQRVVVRTYPQKGVGCSEPTKSPHMQVGGWRQRGVGRSHPTHRPSALSVFPFSFPFFFLEIFF